MLLPLPGVAAGGVRFRAGMLALGAAAGCRCRAPLQDAAAGCCLRVLVLLGCRFRCSIAAPLQVACWCAAGCCCSVRFGAQLQCRSSFSGVLPVQCVARPVLLEGVAGGGARCRCRVLLGLTVQAVCALERALVLLWSSTRQQKRCPLQSRTHPSSPQQHSKAHAAL